MSEIYKVKKEVAERAWLDKAGYEKMYQDSVANNTSRPRVDRLHTDGKGCLLSRRRSQP